MTVSPESAPRARVPVAPDPDAHRLRSLRRRLAWIGVVQIAIWGTHAALYEAQIFPDMRYAMPYRAAELAVCLGLVATAVLGRSFTGMQRAGAILIASLVPVHALVLQVIADSCFVPFLLTMEWGQLVLALAALLSYRQAVGLFALTWVCGVITVTARNGFDPDLSDHLVLLLIYGVVALAIRESERLRASEATTRTELLQLQAESERRAALESQREEFIGELHDGVSSALARAALLLGSARKGASAEEGGILSRARQSVLDALEETRSLLVLRGESHVEWEVGVQELEGAVARALDGFETPWELRPRTDGSLSMLPRTALHALTRVAVEAVTNATKHAPGAALTCELEARDGELRVVVRNERSTAAPSDLKTAGVGLRSAERRLARVGGSLRVDDGDDGFTVTASVPVAVSAAPAA